MKSILYIDNENCNLQSFQISYWNQFDIYTANDTIEGEIIMKSIQLNYIMVEDNLPNEGGCDFVRRIKPSFPNARFIVLKTYAANKKELKECKEMNCKCIEKPWDENELLNILRN